MVIDIPKDHTKRAMFIFAKSWNIHNIPTYISAARNLKAQTEKDGKGRILCIGKVGYSLETQRRLFVCKLGHNGEIFTQVTPLGKIIKNRLAKSNNPQTLDDVASEHEV
jgi:hypothetical protein